MSETSTPKPKPETPIQMAVRITRYVPDPVEQLRLQRVLTRYFERLEDHRKAPAPQICV